MVRRVRMHEAMACQQSGGFGRATTATQKSTARRKNDTAVVGRVHTSSSVLRRSRCERENKARYGQACIGR